MESVEQRPAIGILQEQRDRLSGIWEQRRQIITSLQQANEEQPTNPLEEMRRLRRGEVMRRLEVSINRRIVPHLAQLEEQLTGSMSQLAADYIRGLATAKRDLRSVDLNYYRRGLLTEEEFTSYRQAVEQLEQKPQYDPLLQTALEIYQPQKQVVPPPQEPARPVAQEEEQKQEAELERIQILQDAINSFDNLTETEKRLLTVGSHYSEEKPGSNQDWAREIYGVDANLKKAVDSLHKNRNRALEKVSSKMEMVTVWPEGRGPGRKTAYYLKLKERVAVTEPETVTPPAAEEKRGELPGYILDEINRTITIEGRTFSLTSRFVEFLKPLMTGRPVAIPKLDQILSRLNIKSPAAIVKADIERSVKKKFIETTRDNVAGCYVYFIPTSAQKELDLEKLQDELDQLRARRTRLEQQTQTLVNGQPIVDPAWLLPIDEKIKELEDLLGIKPTELKEIELQPEDIVETTVGRAAQQMEGVEVVPYEPSAEEVRSVEENKILSYVSSSINTNQKISFEALQRELFSPKRVGRAPGGGSRLLIYPVKELKEMFQSALRKIREEALVSSLKKGWGEQDKILWDSLAQAAQKLSGSDMEDFIRKVRSEIDWAEREFYRNSPPPENGGNRVHYIKL